MNTLQQIQNWAESPTINSVGHRPTKRHAISISPFQGLTEKLSQSNRALPYPNDFGLSARLSLIYNQTIILSHTKQQNKEYKNE